MKPNLWGSHGWIFLHTITMNYPNNPTSTDKQIYSNFFKSLSTILPCAKCAHNYSLHLEEYPIEDAVDSKESLVNWLIDIHNEVNESLQKPTLSYEQVMNVYQSESIYKQDKHIYKLIIVILSIFIIGLLCQKQFKNIF
jgi:hypothetical protein